MTINKRVKFNFAWIKVSFLLFKLIATHGGDLEPSSIEITEFEENDFEFAQLLHAIINRCFFRSFWHVSCMLRKMQPTEFMMIVNCKNKYSMWKIDFYLHLIIEILLLLQCCGALSSSSSSTLFLYRTRKYSCSDSSSSSNKANQSCL